MPTIKKMSMKINSVDSNSVNKEITEHDDDEEKNKQVKIPRQLRVKLERSRMFTKSPNLVFMDKLFKKKQGMDIDNRIYSK